MLDSDPYLGRELRSLRARLTAWYVAAFAAILSVFGYVIYANATREIEEGLDRSLGGSLAAIEAEARRGDPARALDRIRIPGRELFLFLENGSPLNPLAPPEWVVQMVDMRASFNPSGFTYEPDDMAGIDDEDSGVDQPDWRVSYRTFAVLDAGGADQYLAVAATNAVELDDQYGALVLAIGIAALAALILAGVGGALLARRATQPVKTSYENMRQFAGDAAHELKTPLATIRTRAETALSAGATLDSGREALAAIADEGRRLGHVVDRLLFLARSNVQEIRVAPEPVHLDDVMFDALPAAQALADEKRIRIRLSANGESAVAGDPVLLRHLLGALLENAVKFSPHGSEIEVDASTANGRAMLTVRDYGPGIPEELQTHVFEPFYRADPSAGGPGGVGLGLSIVRRIALAHEGTVSIRTPSGGGTIVEASFPRADVDARPLASIDYANAVGQ